MNSIFDPNTKAFTLQPKRVIHSSDILPGTIKDRHIDGLILHAGDAADLPDGSTQVKFYYEFDTKKLKIWNEDSEDWDEVQFS